ncbi:MAG: amidohydrolase family protein [Chloroflexi bacterium]|nr:amidohydrolase family protein [Chloroflexota bacterium]
MKIITGATLIDGTGRPPIIDSAVLVSDGGRIEAVGHRQEVIVPPNVEDIDATGMTLLPGLIDCHDHLSSFTYDLMGRWGFAESRSLRHLRIAKVMEDTLLTGYTTIRDCGWLDVGFKQAVEQGLIAGPRLLVATSPLSPTHGMSDRSSPSGHHQPPSPDPNLPLGIADGVDQVRAKVREVVRVGADLVKVFQTGWARPHHGSKDVAFNRVELKALVSEAHIHGKKVASHAIGGAGLRMSVEEGVDTIEHGSYLDEDPDLIKMMADHGTFLVPTLTVFNFHREMGTPEAQIEAHDFRHHHVESVQKAMAAGVRVVAGTDAGGWVHGNNAQELQCLVEAGMTPMEALMAATGWAAECCGLEREIGTVQRGKVADLIVVDGDPLKDITVLQDRSRIKLVMKEGMVHVNRLVSERAEI